MWLLYTHTSQWRCSNDISCSSSRKCINLGCAATWNTPHGEFGWLVGWLKVLTIFGTTEIVVDPSNSGHPQILAEWQKFKSLTQNCTWTVALTEWAKKACTRFTFSILLFSKTLNGKWSCISTVLFQSTDHSERFTTLVTLTYSQKHS